MNVEYSRRALADLVKVAADSRASFGDDVAAAVERRFREVIDRIEGEPESGTPVTKRPGVHVVALVRYPFKLFYRILSAERIKVLHIRHTARQRGNVGAGIVAFLAAGIPRLTRTGPQLVASDQVGVALYFNLSLGRRKSDHIGTARGKGGA